jgi:CRISPR system Cascade subunit CasE
MTTWLTQITPHYRDPLVRNDLRDIIDMHKRVMMLVPDDLGDEARRQAAHGHTWRQHRDDDLG